MDNSVGLIWVPVSLKVIKAGGFHPERRTAPLDPHVNCAEEIGSNVFHRHSRAGARDRLLAAEAVPLPGNGVNQSAGGQWDPVVLEKSRKNPSVGHRTG
jgi:hypothetical protein